MEARKKRLVGVLAVLVIGAVVLGLLALRVDLGAQVTRCLTAVREAGALAFFGAMVVLPMVGFPLSAFIFSAGPVFAPTLGAGTVIGCGIAALALNVTISYWFAAFAMRPWLERLIVWLGYKVPVLPANRAWEANLLLRVVPGVPFFLQNYVLGMARVQFGIYLLVSVGVVSVHLTVAVLAGDALMKGDRTKLIIAGVLFAIVGTGLHFLRKRLMAVRRARKVGSGELT
ncbi:MAG: hypothetical protein WC205_03910 [Opitutaceae bacterium]|jgi:uncharacterized membrane protein YdjX (TVP38/TMEM64 family)